MKVDIETLAWATEKIGEALEALADRAAIARRDIATPTPTSTDPESLAIWLEQAAAFMSLEVEPIESSYAESEGMLLAAGPALVRLPSGSFLAIVRSIGRSVVVLCADLSIRRIPVESVRAAVCAEIEAPVARDVETMIDSFGLAPGQRARARAALLAERLAAYRVRGCWMIRIPPDAPALAQARAARLPSRLFAVLMAHAVQYTLWILSWWMIGNGALQGRFDPGWMMAWVLVLVTIVPIRVLTTWWTGTLAIDTSALIKKRLLLGALRTDPDDLRDKGAGQLIGRVLEAEAIEVLALSGGFLALFSSIELFLAMGALAFGAGGLLHIALLLGWIALTAIIGWQYFARRRRWTNTRMQMTHDLIERLVGHATRLAQEPPETWHDGEDQELARYVHDSHRMDHTMITLGGLVPRGWVLAALAGLAPALITGTTTTATLAIALGGILLAYRALRQMVGGIAHFAGAAIAWEHVGPMFHAAKRSDPVPPPLPASAIEASGRDDVPVVRAQDLLFRYRQRPEPVLRGCSLEIDRNERVLLEGASGSGKSTLGSIVAGLRKPEGGLVLVGGLDRQTLGPDGWRTKVVCAPQFHENHMFSGTLAFNLLMGRRWPPPIEDFAEADELCRELGLGDVLDRMPAGLFQIVGETGWQLSHGERSRVFIARALLQRSELVVLDESLSALDPKTLETVLHTLELRAPALLVIAHP